jgi:hypothetical protein
MRDSLTISTPSPDPAGSGLSERLRLLRRRRQSRLVRLALSTTAWLAVSLLAVGFVVASILTLSS